MKVKTAFRMLKNGDIFQMGPLIRDMEAVVRMHFYYAAIESGFLDAACELKTRDELLEQLDVIQPEILEALIDVGIVVTFFRWDP